MTKPDVFLSIIIPLFNEADNIAPLLDALEVALTGIRHEIILVDDGSTDQTVAAIRQYQKDTTRLVELTRNFGQTAALLAGIDTASGNYIVTMDGDMQNDPADIPAMLSLLLEKKVDMVTGWRKNRKDARIFRRIPSQIANWLMRKACRISIHDSGCTLKIMTAEMCRSIEWRGQMHRFIPALAVMAGGHIAEIEVRHHPRCHGVSKYGLSRTFNVACDLLLLWFLTRYNNRPMHGFGGIGLRLLLVDLILYIICLLAGCASGAYVFLFGILFFLGLQFLALGVFAELVIRALPARKNYVIKSNK